MIRSILSTRMVDLFAVLVAAIAATSAAALVFPLADADPAFAAQDGRGPERGQPPGQGQARTVYFSHLEVGYTDGDGFHVPDPEYSGPDNEPTLERFEADIKPGVADRALEQVVDMLTSHKKQGLLLAFPYYARKHGRVLKKALASGHLVGVHCHDNWKDVLDRRDDDHLAGYFKDVREALEKATGAKIDIVSYGPGIQLDDMGGKETPPKWGSLTDGEKRRLFAAMGAADFKYIQVAREYQKFLPASLVSLDRMGIKLNSIAHSYEWHSRDRVSKAKLLELERSVLGGAGEEKPRDH